MLREHLLSILHSLLSTLLLEVLPWSAAVCPGERTHAAPVHQRLRCAAVWVWPKIRYVCEEVPLPAAQGSMQVITYQAVAEYIDVPMMKNNVDTRISDDNKISITIQLASYDFSDFWVTIRKRINNKVQKMAYKNLFCC